MRKFIAVLVSVTFTAFGCETSFAYGHANSWGHGSTYHAQGSDSTTRTNGYGGEATHTAGQGTSYQNKEGESAYHAEGSGETTASGPNGSATHYQGVGTVGTTSNGNTVYASDHYGVTTA